MEFLDRTIRLCLNRGVRVILLSAPLYPTYAAALPQNQLQNVQQQLSRLAMQYKIPWYNHMHDPRFTVYQFHDDDHLNPRGAAIFTSVVNEYIRQAK
jgi:lysophospholipase L1-like esterase